MFPNDPQTTGSDSIVHLHHLCGFHRPGLVHLQTVALESQLYARGLTLQRWPHILSRRVSILSPVVHFPSFTYLSLKFFGQPPCSGYGDFTTQRNHEHHASPPS